MGNFGIGEWIIVLLVILVLFGAKKIPDLAKGIGKGIKDFKNAVKDDQDDKPSDKDKKSEK
jgi:sec-independent protein translocase protein TatA